MRSETVGDLLADAVARHGDAPAMLYHGGAVSYRALEARSRRVAAGLRALGISAGDRVALWLPNVPAYMVLFFALARLGAVAVAVNTRFRSAEVEDIVGRSGCRALVMWPDFKDIDFPGILGRVDPAKLIALRTVIVYGEEAAPPDTILGRPAVAFDRLEAATPIAGERPAPDAPCAIFTTSGTTKAPKFVLHGQAGLARHAREVSRYFGLDAPDAVTLAALPLCGVFGFCQMLATLAGGGCAVMHPLFDPSAAAEAIIAHRVTHMMGTDDMFARILAARPESRPFPSLRLCGFAAFNPAIDRFLAECDRRGVPLAGLYGMSEIQALFAVQHRGDPVERRGVGGGYVVSPTAQVRVRDPETGELQPPGRSGELEFRGPSLMLRYDGDAEATAAAFTADGWFRSGDAGHLREDGSFVFETRMGDVLRLAGFLTAPGEIEAFIERHGSVAGVQVVGVTTRKGPRPFAFIVPRPGRTVDEAALREHCRRGLADYKVPIRFVQLDAFPVAESANATKVQRATLRAMAQSIVRDMEAGAA